MGTHPPVCLHTLYADKQPRMFLVDEDNNPITLNLKKDTISWTQDVSQLGKNWNGALYTSWVNPRYDAKEAAEKSRHHGRGKVRVFDECGHARNTSAMHGGGVFFLRRAVRQRAIAILRVGGSPSLHFRPTCLKCLRTGANCWELYQKCLRESTTVDDPDLTIAKIRTRCGLTGLERPAGRSSIP